MKYEYEGFEKMKYFPESYWERRTPTIKLDTVKATEDDLIKASNLRGEPNRQWRLMQEPALPYFSLIVRASEDPDMEFRFDFEPMPDDASVKISDDGAISVPTTACLISSRWPEKPWWTPTLGGVLGILHDDDFRAPCAKFEWLRECDIDDPVGFVNSHLRQALGIYLTIQALLKNRPEVFITRTVPASSLAMKGDHSSSYHGKHKAKMCHVITLEGDRLPVICPASSREFTCPCWGVIGHVRHYKSGKEVWIAPYRKGKHRNDPAAYIPKEYTPYREDEV